MKTLCKVLALVLVFAFTFALASCGTTHYSEEFVQEGLDDIVRKIKNHNHIHTARLLPGMTEDEFAPVEQAIHKAIHDGDYTITYKDVTDYTDDDDNHVYFVTYVIASGSNSVTVEVMYVDTHDTLYRIELK